MKPRALLSFILAVYTAFLGIAFGVIQHDQAQIHDLVATNSAITARLCAVERYSFYTLSWYAARRAATEQTTAPLTPALKAAQDASEVRDKQEASSLAAFGAAIKNCPP